MIVNAFLGCLVFFFVVADHVRAEGAGTSLPVDATQSNATVVHQLEVVDVTEQERRPGSDTIADRQLQSLPSHSGSITEALKGQSNVQFANDSFSSLTAGEIRPPRVSIAGAKPYENSFLINGMSITNTLNPSGLGAGETVNRSNLEVNGGDQTIFYDTSLIDSVTVYSSNVPAKYGNFVGGVVDARLADPRTDRWGGVVSGRHTRSEWSRLRGVDHDSDTPDNQPKYRTSTVYASVDGPVSDAWAVLLAASRKQSTIPLQKKESGEFVDKDQYRTNDNVFGKILYSPDDSFRMTLDLTYAPYSEERWKSGWLDSDWRVENESYRLGSEAVWITDMGVWTGGVSFAANGYSRDYDSNVWYSDTTQSPAFQSGGLGDATTRNRSSQVRLDYETHELDGGEWLWILAGGVDISHATTNMWNEMARMEGFTAGTITETEYEEIDQTKTLNTVGWYGQAEARWKRLSLFPGLRLDYEDFSHNVDLAPRFRAEWDTMGDGMLRLTGGANRYYGGQLRAYAFDRYRPFVTKSTNRKSGEVKYINGKDRSYSAKGLETPYSDELAGGLLGTALGFDYGLEYVHRDHKKQVISKTRDGELYELTNDGKSVYDGLTFTVGRSYAFERFGAHTFSLGVTQSRTKTFNGAFDSDEVVNRFSGGYAYNYDRVYYDGASMSRSDLPAEDYNAPTVVTFSWLGSFWDDRLRINSVSRWRDSTTGLKKDERPADETPYGTTASKKTTPSAQWLNAQGEYQDAYTKGVISGGLVSDVSLEYDALRTELLTMSMLLDITNIFASDAHSGVVEGHSVRGRTYYAGLRCEF